MNAKQIRNIVGRRHLISPCLLMLTLLAPCFVRAQQFEGAITGTVKDKSGALVRNAAIMATDIQTGVIFKSKTNEDGQYSIVG